MVRNKKDYRKTKDANVVLRGEAKGWQINPGELTEARVGLWRGNTFMKTVSLSEAKKLVEKGDAYVVSASVIKTFSNSGDSIKDGVNLDNPNELQNEINRLEILLKDKNKMSLQGIEPYDVNKSIVEYKARIKELTKDSLITEYKGFDIFEDKTTPPNIYYAEGKRSYKGKHLTDSNLENLKGQIDKFNIRISKDIKINETPDSEFDSDELALGIKTEMEHTDNKEEATSIAKDHLLEDSKYYTKLVKMEAKDGADSSTIGNLLRGLGVNRETSEMLGRKFSGMHNPTTSQIREILQGQLPDGVNEFQTALKIKDEF